jgi:hypothetical protein
MSRRRVLILCIALGVIGLFLAGVGIGMNAREGQQGSGSVFTWSGVAIAILAGFLPMILTKKPKE